MHYKLKNRLHRHTVYVREFYCETKKEQSKTAYNSFINTDYKCNRNNGKSSVTKYIQYRNIRSNKCGEMTRTFRRHDNSFQGIRKERGGLFITFYRFSTVFDMMCDKLTPEEQYKQTYADFISKLKDFPDLYRQKLQKITISIYENKRKANSYKIS